MTIMPRVLFALAVWLALVARADAAPVRCSYGYQDSSCTTPIQNAPIPQPQCQSGAGWTTVSAAVWQGSRWSAPQCNYQAPPACPSGYDMVLPSSWSGSSWTQPTCTPHVTPQPSATPLSQCRALYFANPAPYPSFTPSKFVTYSNDMWAWGSVSMSTDLGSTLVDHDDVFGDVISPNGTRAVIAMGHSGVWPVEFGCVIDNNLHVIGYGWSRLPTAPWGL